MPITLMRDSSPYALQENGPPRINNAEGMTDYINLQNFPRSSVYLEKFALR